MPNPVWLDTLGFIHVKKVIVNNFKVQLNATIHNLIKFCFWFSQRRVFLLVMLSMYKVELLWFLPWTIKPPEFSVLPNFLNWCLGVKVWRPDLLFCQLSTNRFCTEQTAGYCWLPVSYVVVWRFLRWILVCKFMEPQDFFQVLFRYWTGYNSFN